MGLGAAALSQAAFWLSLLNSALLPASSQTAALLLATFLCKCTGCDQTQVFSGRGTVPLESVLPIPMADDFKALQEFLACIKESRASRESCVNCIYPIRTVFSVSESALALAQQSFVTPLPGSAHLNSWRMWVSLKISNYFFSSDKYHNILLAYLTSLCGKRPVCTRDGWVMEKSSEIIRECLTVSRIAAS